jgi:hypothetical protein
MTMLYVPLVEIMLTIWPTFDLAKSKMILPTLVKCHCLPILPIVLAQYHIELSKYHHIGEIYQLAKCQLSHCKFADCLYTVSEWTAGKFTYELANIVFTSMLKLKMLREKT